MTKMRKVKRSLATAILVWIGRRMLGRVQKRTLRSVTEKPKFSKFSRMGRKAPEKAVRGLRRLQVRKTSAKPGQRSAQRRRRTGQGILFAVLSAAAVAALKVGVEHVIENEREQHVVTPDFDVFADDEE
jgi:hypothetical protein